MWSITVVKTLTACVPTVTNVSRDAAGYLNQVTF